VDVLKVDFMSKEVVLKLNEKRQTKRLRDVFLDHYLSQSSVKLECCLTLFNNVMY